MAETETEATATAAATEEVAESDDFAFLLQKEFKPKSERAKEAVEEAVKTLAEQALAKTNLISDDAIKSIESIIAEIDKRLSDQVNKIMHHPDFQKLEGSWRGMHYLVNNTETDEMLKIKVFNISKKELHKTLSKFKGTAWDQSPIFKKIYEHEYGQFGGEPFGCLVGDYEFDHCPTDIEFLNGIAEVSAAAHVPFIAAAAPSLMNMETWQELSNPR
ncbi:MAG: type VI secretion system contractile sheath domain-containing protein, partial [Methylosarcina sp.]